MSALRRLLREPLLHFLVLALAIFAIYGLIGRWRAEETDRIEVTPARIEQLATLFAATWQRPPAAEELKGLIDDYVKEEIYYREAKKLGLDVEDTVVRRRLRLKMEFLNDAGVDSLVPSDADLQAYLRRNPAKFETGPETAFEQVFLNPQKRSDRIDQDAGAILASLNSASHADFMSLGDATLLPAELPLSSGAAIGQTFGMEFAEAMNGLPVGVWAGPVASSFGFHIVRVAERKPGRVPLLAEVRDAVAREWANDKRKELEERSFNELLKRYSVVIEKFPESKVSP